MHLGKLAFLLAVVAIGLLVPAAVGAMTCTRPGTIPATITLQDGSPCVLDGEECEAAIGDFVFVREPWDSSVLLPIWARVPAGAIAPGNPILIEGTKITAYGQPVVVASRIALYVDAMGHVWPFSPKNPKTAYPWDYLRDVPLGALTSPIPAIPDPTPVPVAQPPMTGDPGTVAGAKLSSEDAASCSTRNPSAMSYPVGSISLTGKIVTAVFYAEDGSVDSFYIQEPGQPCGIRVVPENAASVELHDVVSVSGTVVSGATTGEAYIDAASVARTGSGDLPRPLGLTNKATAGAAFGAQPALYLTPQAVGKGLNATGVRVKVWGKLLLSSDEDNSRIFYIDDGSRLLRSDGQYGLKVVYHRVEDAPSVSEGDYVVAIGVLGAEVDDGNPVPVLHVPNKRVIHVKPDGNDENMGYSWDTAKATIAGALQMLAWEWPLRSEIWVAQGTYTERLSISSGLTKIYGGFAGNENDREQRNWALHPTIVDGNHGGSVFTVTAQDGFVLDGFVVRNGTRGIYCSAPCTIANNVIRGNTPSGGLFLYNCVASVAGNVFLGNSAAYGGAISLSGCPSGFITNNTITTNTGSTSCGGVYLSGSSPTVSNNIIALNTGGGVCKAGSGSPTLRKNDVYGNTSYAYSALSAGVDDISLDPCFAVSDQDAYHIQPNSPCVDAAWSGAPGIPRSDIDRQARPWPAGGSTDIGADECDGCGWYLTTMTCDPSHGEPGGSVEVAVHVSDWDGNPVPATRIALCIQGGSITLINGQVVGGQPYYGSTDASGCVSVAITRPDKGSAIVTASVDRACGPGSSSSSERVWFWSGTPRVVFCIDCTASTESGDEIRAGVCATVDCLAGLAPCLFGGVKFNNSNLLEYAGGTLTTDTAAFKNWVNASWGGGSTELPFEALLLAASRAPAGFLALATDEDSDSTQYTAQQTAALLSASGCMVFVDPGVASLESYYSPIAVNGGVVERATVGTFTFPTMRQAVAGMGTP
jgi:parallel beta-helix repeat protein